MKAGPATEGAGGSGQGRWALLPMPPGGGGGGGGAGRVGAQCAGKGQQVPMHAGRVGWGGGGSVWHPVPACPRERQEGERDRRRGRRGDVSNQVNQPT